MDTTTSLIIDQRLSSRSATAAPRRARFRRVTALPLLLSFAIAGCSADTDTDADADADVQREPDVAISVQPLHVRLPGVGAEAQGAGAAIAALDEDPRPEMVILAYDNPATSANSFRYRVIKNLSENGVGTYATPSTIVAGVGEAEEAGAAFGQIDGNSRPDLFLAAYTQPTATTGRRLTYKIGFNVSSEGAAATWSSTRAIDLGGDPAQGAGIALGDIDGDATPDMVVMAYESGAGTNTFMWRIGWDVSSSGVPASLGPIQSITGLSDDAQGAGITLADLDRNGRPELVFMAYNNPAGENRFGYKVAWNLSTSGTPTIVDPSSTEISGVGSEGQGADIVAASLDGNPTPELMLIAYDNPSGENSFRYKVVKNNDEGDVYPGADVLAWRRPGSLFTSAAPAVSGHVDGQAWIAAVTTTGAVQVMSSSAPGVFSAYSTINGAPAFGFAQDTAPVLLRDDSSLLLFARGADNDLYRATRVGTGGWTTFTRLTSTGRIRGRLEATLTRAGTTPELHLVYPTEGGAVEYARIVNGSLAATRLYANALDGALGSDATGQILIGVRKTDRVIFERATRTASWAFSTVTTRMPAGGEVFDISNLVFFGGSFHVLYAQRHATGDVTGESVHELTHLRFRPGVSYDGFSRRITDYTPTASDQSTLSRLEVFRNKLVAAYRGPDHAVRYARLDNADPTLPWVNGNHVSDGYTATRPALGVVDRTSMLTAGDYNQTSYAIDMVAAVKGNSGTAGVYVAPFSRAAMRSEIVWQLALYDAGSEAAASTGTMDLCRDQSQSFGPTPVDLAQEGRPILGEIGMSLWMLPWWFEQRWYYDIASDLCSNGNEKLAASGRFDAPCSGSRFPVILRDDKDSIFVCQGAWQYHTNRFERVWEELGHYSASGLGLHDNATRPNADDAARSSIPLSALDDAAGLFRERVGSCSTTSATRCRGFAGIDNNYDSNSAQHSFIYVVHEYVNNGDELRSFVQADLAIGDNLLQRKYNWVKTWLFRGVEFRGALEPVTQL